MCRHNADAAVYDAFAHAHVTISNGAHANSTVWQLYELHRYGPIVTKNRISYINETTVRTLKLDLILSGTTNCPIVYIKSNTDFEIKFLMRWIIFGLEQES